MRVWGLRRHDITGHFIHLDVDGTESSGGGCCRRGTIHAIQR